MNDSIMLKNDLFRTTFTGFGRVVLTESVSESKDQQKIITAVKRFNSFTPDNDPFGEKDCGIFKVNGEKFIWKIDYYENEKCEYGFAFEEDKPDTAFRILTIMSASDY